MSLTKYLSSQSQSSKDVSFFLFQIFGQVWSLSIKELLCFFKSTSMNLLCISKNNISGNITFVLPVTLVSTSLLTSRRYVCSILSIFVPNWCLLWFGLYEDLHFIFLYERFATCNTKGQNHCAK